MAQMETRIEVLEAALRRLEARILKLEQDLERLNTPTALERAKAKRASLGKTRSKSMSLSWLIILENIAEKGDASIDDIEIIITEKRLGIQRSAVRAQLSAYKSRKSVESIGEAQYRLTPFGRKILAHEKRRTEGR